MTGDTVPSGPSGAELAGRFIPGNWPYYPAAIWMQMLALSASTPYSNKDAYEGVATSAFAIPLSAHAFADSSVMELTMRSARSGSVAATASAMPLSAQAFTDSQSMKLAMRSARSGSVAAAAFATPLSARTCVYSEMMKPAMRSASARSQPARLGSVAASASAMPLSADAFEDPSVM